MATTRTGAGDAGYTDLLGRRRVPKYHPIAEALGEVDEATSALGLARAGLPPGEPHDLTRRLVEAAQHDLYQLMAELAFPPAHAQARRLTQEDVHRLDAAIRQVQAAADIPAKFVLPGETRQSAGLDFARAVVRRAERAVVRVLHLGAGKAEAAAPPEAPDAADTPHAPDILDYPSSPFLAAYLNRLSLLLYVLARYEDAVAGAAHRLAGQ